MKLIRRSIIFICSVMLIQLLATCLPNFLDEKYYNPELKALVKSGKAEVIEVNKKIKIDKDTIYIERIINTDTQTNVRYKIVEEPGWSFSNIALALYDEKGKKQYQGGGSSGKLWGEDGIISYERIDKASKEIRIKLEWYDRVGEVSIPIKNEVGK